MFGTRTQPNSNDTAPLGGDCGCPKPAPASVDPRRPAPPGPATTIEGQLAGIHALLARLAEQLTPGAPGRQNAEPIPELRTYAVAVATDPLPIIANGRRSALYLHNLGPSICYVVSSPDLAATDGLPIAVNAGLPVPLPVRNHVWLISASTSDVRVGDVAT